MNANYFLSNHGIEPGDTSDAYLEHHGILGMKWGRRKARPVSSRQQRANEKLAKAKAEYKVRQTEAQAKAYKESDPAALVSTASKKKKSRPKAATLDDEDLQNLVQRMTLERSYRMLTAEENQASKSFISKVLAQSADKAAVAVTTRALTKAASNILKLD